MALSDTSTAIDCIPTCDSLTQLNEGEFYDFIIDRLATAAGVDLADITAEQLSTAVDEARCAFEGSQVFASASPETKQAIVLHLIAQL